jgi:uncharacterized protein YcaQ
VLALVDEGLLREVHADDGGPPFYVDAEADLDGAPAPPVLLCPFDNLLWDRPLVERLFGFRHVMEIYKREHEREYGYYVLPLLVGDRIAGRAEPRFDRKAGTLELLGAWGDTSRLDEALAPLDEWLGATAST